MTSTSVPKETRSPMRKVLIANRGEIALRVIRAARSLGLATAVVYSDADVDALFVAEADEAVLLPGNAAAETYLVADKVLEAAARVGADAIHPGYGFLSENADFAQACQQAGLTFIGPPASAIRSMGDKVESKRLMEAGGVPVLTGITVTDDDESDVAAQVADIGLPAIVKASAGGGGRGMRIVDESKDLLAEIDSARREAQSSFGNGTVFIEKYVSPSRHIEVQVVADAHGNVAALFERECSIQRRHQKVVEEAPSSFVTPQMRERLVEAAILAVKAVDYLGLGTVEFVAGADGEFAFLEMNTRLQVEHPVTELVTGLDLVRMQIEVAAGRPLPRQVLEADLHGHAIEVRLCAEDVDAGYLPVSGTFSLFEIGGQGIRVDSGVRSGSQVPPFYDSMVAKVIAWADTRRGAASLLADALERARLHGITTNRDLLVKVLRSEPFLAGDTTTDFLERVPDLTGPRTTDDGHRQHAAVAALAYHHLRAQSRGVQQAIPSGWRNNRAALETIELRRAGEDESLLVGVDLNSASPILEVAAQPLALDLHRITDRGDTRLVVDATTDGIRRRFSVACLPEETGTGLVVLVDSVLGDSSFTLVDRLPAPGASGPRGGLSAPMPGLVARIMVAAGEQVTAGQPLMVLEAMKMEHTLTSPHDGSVTEINVTEGEQVERGAVLAAVEAAEVAE